MAEWVFKRTNEEGNTNYWSVSRSYVLGI